MSTPDLERRGGQVRPMEERDLALVLEWRNHPEVRHFMYTRHEIMPDEHRRWFETCRQQPGRHLLIYDEEHAPLGFINLSPTGFSGVADWGFYAAATAPKGTGQRLGRAAMRYAFQTLGLHKVCGEALEYNERSIRMHERLGFSREGCLREHYFDGTTYHSVIRFGLLSQEWADNS